MSIIMHGVNIYYCYTVMVKYFYSCTLQFNAADNISSVWCRRSSGTRVQFVVEVEILRVGTSDSTLLMALTMPVSSKSMARPHSFTMRHRWGDIISASSGNRAISDSSNKKVSSSWQRHIPHKYVAFSFLWMSFMAVSGGGGGGGGWCEGSLSTWLCRHFSSELYLSSNSSSFS